MWFVYKELQHFNMSACSTHCRDEQAGHAYLKAPVETPNGLRTTAISVLKCVIHY